MRTMLSFLRQPACLIAGLFYLLPSCSTAQSISPAPQLQYCLVKDEQGKPIPYASVQIKGTKRGWLCDENGRFGWDKATVKDSVTVSSMSYETRTVALEPAPDAIVLKQQICVMKEVVLVNETHYRRRGCGIRTCYIRCLKTMPVKKATTISVSIFPNPLPRGTAATVVAAVKQDGLFTIQLADASGRVLQQQKITSVNRKINANVSTSSAWAAGMVYLRITDDKGNFAGTGSLLVQ